MIKKLAGSLKQSVHDREELKKEASCLTDQVHALQTQLHSVGQQMQQPQVILHFSKFLCRVAFFLDMT